jgi:hypothetical protein
LPAEFDGDAASWRFLVYLGEETLHDVQRDCQIHEFLSVDISLQDEVLARDIIPLMHIQSTIACPIRPI